MKILRADHLGMCFGVRDAIALAVQHSRTAPLTILGDLVHNEHVLAGLRARGIRLEKDLAQVPTRDVMITAHGASAAQIRAVRQHGHQVVEATCPLVHFAHRSVQQLVEAGYHPVIIGLRHHVEVHGLTGDLAAFDVVLTEAEVDALAERPRFGVAAQTTQPVERVQRLVQRLRRRFPAAEVRCVDTVCQPTKLRQKAAVDLAQQCDVVVVLGGNASNNTRELVATCRAYCPNVYHVQGPDDVQAEWLQSAAKVGLTAGTSTPDDLIEAVYQRLEQLAASVHLPLEHETAALAAV